MADVKWVKIMTDMFDNRKIRHLRRLPDGNNIVLIWVMLLTMAGRCNAGGMIFLTENIAYTTKMLADELDFEENTVILALKSLEQLGMITMDGQNFRIAGWDEYQNIEGMDRIREQNRLRKQRHRKRMEAEKQQALPASRDSHVTVTESHATDIEEDTDIKKGEIREYTCDSGAPESPSPAPKQAKPVKHKYGEYQNVLLTDDELAKLQGEYTDWQERIERLSAYIASKGTKYKSHYATIRNWARKDGEKHGANRAGAGQGDQYQGGLGTVL
ncbi:MAG: phage replisome organizer N-terminal domain-containing protein [Aristaeellaceae bacterium]